MVTTNWREMQRRAVKFVHRWKDESREAAEAKSFWDDFFRVFGRDRKAVASFEAPVRNLRDRWSFIDLFWKGTLLVEHKSRGKDLGRAASQAFDYIQYLQGEGREEEAPDYVIVSDFERIALHELETGRVVEFPLAELPEHAHLFGFIAGFKQASLEPQDPLNIRAAEIMAKLHDALEDGGYSGHRLERFLVRILFCLFAEDTGIFDTDSFSRFIENYTRQDGFDLGAQLARFFAVLNTPREQRQTSLDDALMNLPYVNGELFREDLGFAEMDRAMREALLRCAHFHWAQISPAIFGSLFQSVMEPRERRRIGGHYTSERDILKLIRALFLDELRAQFEKIRHDRRKLQEFQRTLAGLRFLDPACGCGNFLVVTYRELRLLELEVIKILHGGRQQELDIKNLTLIDMESMCGIEISEFPARIAEVAMWLVDHQMNRRLSNEFGAYFMRLPLAKSARIRVGNALLLDWNEVLPAGQCSYVLGNPPFVGKSLMTKEQNRETAHVWGDAKRSGVLDYVTAWYRKAAEYAGGTRIRAAFVSTNSITQGEQADALWTPLFRDFGLKIHFAYRTFPWESEARGKAHVHVVIVGFGAFDTGGKRIYEFDGKNDKLTVTEAKNISPYLVEGNDLAVPPRARPLCPVPECGYGSKPADGGHLLLTEEQRQDFVAQYPDAAPYLRPLLSAAEYLHGRKRWCLWLPHAKPSDIRSIRGLRERVGKVREFRLASKKAATRELAGQPALFAEIRQPTTRFVLVPQHTSERRDYVPFGYFEPENILHNSCSAIPEASLYHFGVLSSEMHMAWLRHVGGRIKSDFRYSTRQVYNNFPWPQVPSEKQSAAVEKAAAAVLAARDQYPDQSPADLYDPLAMPRALHRAHEALDRVVDRCYRQARFPDDQRRMPFLLKLYEKLAAPLAPVKGRKAQR
ncbi:MAG: hypothetical protein P9L99_08340 [Candidatus Lernaella stagnicola]|nr:hypothetical protein [Candidatus Lernaella stagnicola]